MKVKYRILVSGFFNAGKTTLIHTLDPDAFSIETPLSKYTKDRLPENLKKGMKDTTTTGFDRGIVIWVRRSRDSTGVITSLKEFEEAKEDYSDWLVDYIELKGVPGQLHFNVVRETLSKGMDGTILLIDGSDIASIGNALAILEETKIYMKGKPIIIVANKADLPDFVGEDEISNFVGDVVFSASALYNIGIKDALIELLKKIELQKVQQGV